MAKIIVLLGEDSLKLDKKHNSKFMELASLGVMDYSYPEIHGTLPRSEKEIINRVDYIISQFREKNVNVLLVTHSEIVFHYLRALIAEDILKVLDIEILLYEFYDEFDDVIELELNTYGQVLNFPARLFCMNMHLCGRILRAHNKNQAVCALVIREDAKILAVSRKDDPDDFGLPGGKIHLGESKQQALIREIKEETGLDAKIGVPIHFGYDKNNCYVTTYLTEVAGKISTNESGVVAWVERETLLKGSFSDYNEKLFARYDKLDSKS